MLTVDLDRLGVKTGSLVLDIGVGNGRHSFAALKLGADCVSIDLDQTFLPGVHEMAEAMRDSGETRPDALTEVLRGDALNLPFPDATFDHVIAAEVLEHIPADADAMSEIARVLKPKGRAAVTVPRFWPERVCWALSKEYTQSAGGHVRIYRAGELRNRLLEAGLIPEGSHHAHAFHAPYWWIKCAAGIDNEDALPARAYKWFLEWQIVNRPRTLDALERVLDPVLGKSHVVYVTKPESVAVQVKRVA